MPKNEIPKAYEPAQYEDAIYAAWEASGFFNPDLLPGKRKEIFSMMLPPPNVTGTLHLGHAVMLAIEDIMVRFARMRGKKTLWLPGTDHAAIATQSKVEGILKKETGKSRHDLGREAFLEEVRKFAAKSHDTIVGQCRKMGASLDWSREAYTLDAARNKAVNTVFKMMCEDGLIYRGSRVINWDPVGQTVISDDEVVDKEVQALFFTFRYSKDFPIAISTTRPETKVGDTAVAVHPKDERYAKFVGKTFDVSFAGADLKIKIVADISVDPTFGTGALGVTPAHSVIDSEIASRHQLPMIQVIGEDGRMMPPAGSLVAGKTVLEARETIVAWLREQNLLEKEEVVTQNLSTAERTGGVIEPLPKLQWFVNVTKEFKKDGKTVTLKSLMQDAVRSGKVKILPERFEKTYFHWIDNLRDWCISRQLWFGHRVPVWYRSDRFDETSIGAEPPQSENWEQDPDTLDTWFSAGLWTFSTLGWPGKTEDFETYHPTTVLETGYDILFHWVARMILMSEYALGETPFKTVYLHGLVRDEQGRKMSKSLGNVIDPVEMIKKYGADATRLSLVLGTSPGNDSKLSEEKIAGFRNFTNKLWNISRFVLSSVDQPCSPMPEGGFSGVGAASKPVTLADRWILSRFAFVTERVTSFLESYDFSAAGELLRDFTWSEFADWYLEIAKVQRADENIKVSTEIILVFILERLLALWHPFMPFVTEEIWKQFNVASSPARGEVGMGGSADFLMIHDWPKVESVRDEKAEEDFQLVRDIIVAIRNIRSQSRIEPAREIEANFDIGFNGKMLEENGSVIVALSRLCCLGFKGRPVFPYPAATAVIGDVTIHVEIGGTVDAKKERSRLEKELEELKSYIVSAEAKLANTEFIAKAPTKVVEAMRAKKTEAEQKQKEMKRQLESL